MRTLRDVLAVAWKDLQLIAKDRGSLVLYFLLPLFLGSMTAGVNLIVANQEDQPTILVRVVLVNLDAGGFGNEIVRTLEEIQELEIEHLNTITAAEGRVASGDASAAILISSDFSAKIDSHIPTQIEVIVDPAEPQGASIVTGIMNQVVDEVAIWGEVQYGVRNLLDQSGLLEQASLEQRRGIEAQTLGAIMTSLNEMRSNPPILVVNEDLTGVAVEGGMQGFIAYLFPGFTVLFIFFMVAGTASWLLVERESGALRRIVASPLSTGALLGGKLLAYTTIPCLQAILLFGVANRFFGMSLGKAPLALAVLTLVTALTSTGLGLLVASFTKSSTQASNIGTLLGFVLGGISGCFPTQGEPLSRAGGFISYLSKITPQTHAVEGYYRLFAENASFAQVLPQIAILLGMCLVFFIIAIRRFQFNQ